MSLTLLAIPNFLNFRARAAQTEARANLGAIHTSQVSYFSEGDCYSGGTEAFAQLQFIPISGRNRYTYIIDQSVLPGTIPINPLPEGIASSQNGFTAIAVSNLDSDPFIDFWAINENRDIRNQQVDSSGWGADGSDVRGK